MFDRTARTTVLTPAGERLKPFAEEVLRQLEIGRRDALAAAHASTETLLFASTHALSLTFFPPWLRALEREQALMSSIQLTAESMEECERLMIDGAAQFLLCHVHPAASTHLSADRFKSVVLGNDRLLPVAAPLLSATNVLQDGPFLADYLRCYEVPYPVLQFWGIKGN